MVEFHLAFYGDDFTGSTDALQALSTGGVRAILFTTPPTDEEIEQFDDLEAIGVAGQSRTMTPEEMDNPVPFRVDKGTERAGFGRRHGMN